MIVGTPQNVLSTLFLKFLLSIPKNDMNSKVENLKVAPKNVQYKRMTFFVMSHCFMFRHAVMKGTMSIVANKSSI